MENISAKKCGRPRTWVGHYREEAARSYPQRSRRHLDNENYKIRAVALVADDPRFGWLMSDGPTIRAGQGHMRHTILAELGRIDDPQAMEAMALYLCEHRPTTREAVVLMRAYRLGRHAPSTPAQLAVVIRSAINTYLSVHQTLSWDEVRQALYDVLGDIDATEG
jgi:hypothetical protein